MASWMDYYNDSGQKRKRKSTKYVMIKGRKYKVVAAGRKKRSRPADLNGSGMFGGGMYGMGNQSMFGYGGEPRQRRSSPRQTSPVQEYVQAGQNIYNMYKGARDSPLAGFVAKKIRQHREKKQFEKAGFKKTEVSAGRSKVGFLKPNKMELKHLREKSRLRDTPY